LTTSRNKDPEPQVARRPLATANEV